MAAVPQQGIAGQQRQTVAVAEDGQPVAVDRLGRSQSFGGAEQLFDVVHPQDAGALEHRIVDRILDRASPEIARLEHDHRLDPGGGASGGHEFAAVAGILHVHQDGAGIAIPQQIINQIAQIHIPAHPHRDHVREPDVAAGSPVNHAAGDRRGLTQQRDVARQWPGRVQTGVDIGRRHGITEMIRPDEAQQIGLGSRQNLLHQGFTLIRVFAQHFLTEQRRPGAAMILQHFPTEQQRRPGPPRTQLADQGRGLFKRGRQNRQVRRDRQTGDILIGQYARNGPVVRIDRHHRPFETAFDQIELHSGVRTVGGFAATDDRDGAGLEQIFEIANGHEAPLARKNRRDQPAD